MQVDKTSFPEQRRIMGGGAIVIFALVTLAKVTVYATARDFAWIVPISLLYVFPVILFAQVYSRSRSLLIALACSLAALPDVFLFNKQGQTALAFTSLLICVFLPFVGYTVSLVFSLLCREMETTQRVNRDLSTLNAVANTVSQTLALEEMLTHTLDKVLEVVKIAAGGIFLGEPEGHRLVLKAYRDSEAFSEAPWSQTTILWGEGITGQVAKTGEPARVADVDDIPALAKSEGAKGFRSLASIPLKAGGKVVGALNVASRMPRKFTNEDLALLSSIGSQIGVAIQNARLYEEVANQKERLEEQARTDFLTGIYNRQYFEELLEREIERVRRYGGRLAVVMADVNRFKSINDNHGHRVGDDVLKVLGTVLREHCRLSDVAARYGGDEFVIAMPELDCEGAHAAVERLRQRIDQYRRARNLEMEITISVGVSSSAEDDLLSLPELADQRMYKEKRRYYAEKGKVDAAHTR